MADLTRAIRHRTTLHDIDGTRASQILRFVSDLDLQAAGRRWVVLDDEDVTLGGGSMMMQAVR